MIDRDEVVRIARLAHLDLTEQEIERFQVELNDLLGFVGTISELRLNDVPPTPNSTGMKNVLRADVVRPSLAVEDVLANAPAVEQGFFRVPASG